MSSVLRKVTLNRYATFEGDRMSLQVEFDGLESIPATLGAAAFEDLEAVLKSWQERHK